MSNRKKVKSPKLGYSRTMERIDAIKETFSGKYNAYMCGTCDKAFLTLDVDPGTTPLFIKCLATEGCTGSAMSAGYPEGDPPASLGDPIVHWVKPSKQELGTLPPAMITHVKEGGLIAKPTEVTPDWVKVLLHKSNRQET